MLLSEEYREHLKKMHRSRHWRNPGPVPPMLKNAIALFFPLSILDFGSGKGGLTRNLKNMYPHIECFEYDPYNDDELPDEVDMLISNDVMEHIEPDFLANNISKMTEISKQQFHKIACYPATAILPDGRNAHLIIQKPDWWRERFIDSGNKIVNERVDSCQRNSSKGLINQVEYSILLERDEG